MNLQYNRIKYIAFFVLAVFLLPIASARAAPAVSLPVVSGQVVRDSARITFEWPKSVTFKATANDKIVTITFARAAKPDFGPLLSSLYPYVTSAQKEADGKTIVLHLNKPYKIRTFIADNISGIDILGIDPTERMAMQEAGNPLAALAPAAEGDAPETPKQEVAQGADADHPENLKINISAAPDSAVIRLPFAQRAAIAVFIRNNYLWIVLDKPYVVDLSDFDNLQKTIIGKGELLDAKQTVIRVPLDDNIFASVAKEETSFEWAILLTQVRKTPAKPLKIDINTDPPAPPHVFINSLEMGDPVTMKDPIAGDELIAVPLYQLGEGIAVGREFVEFSALQTAQGVAIAKKADDVVVTPLRNGLRIAMPQGTNLTPGLPTIEVAPTEASLANIPTLFPYEKWQLADDTPRRTQLQLLLRSIVENTNHREANEQRIRLAQIYLGEGLAAEALGILANISRTDPIFYRTSKLAALHGAANFLMYRFSDAIRDFSAPELNNNKEVEFWRSMLADLLGNPTSYDYLAMNADYISKYPPLFRQRLAIYAANHAIDEKNYNAALKIFDTLQPKKDDAEDKDSKETKLAKQEDLLTPIKPYVNYLFAKISAETGQEDEGKNTWDELANDYSNPFVQTHAQFSKIIWEVNHDTIDREQAIEKLEHLRLSWHGDAMELKILELLGNFYNDKKDYVNAMRVWDSGVSAYPSTPVAIEMAHKMRETFLLMFSEESVNAMTPMDELVLYYQYKNYAPTNGASRDITDHLADRLVAIDLLEQAATLLDHEMRFDADKTRRSQIGAKVSKIYLMAHEPKKALKALQDSVYGESPSALREMRNLITAQALFETNEPDKAIKIIEHDDGAEAEHIRLNIYWQRKDWPHVITTAENLLKLRKNVSAPVTIDESESVMKLALAYRFNNETIQLQYLRDYFGPLMEKNPNKAVFDFITATDITPTPENFDEVIKQLSDTRSFINGYKAKIETAGLTNTAAAPAPAATAKP